MSKKIFDKEVSKRFLEKIIEMTDERSINWETEAVTFNHGDCLFLVSMEEDEKDFSILSVKVNDVRNEEATHSVQIEIVMPFVDELVELIEEKKLEDLINEINNANEWSNSIEIDFSEDSSSDYVMLKWENFTITRVDSDNYIVESSYLDCEADLKDLVSGDKYHLLCYNVESFLKDKSEKIIATNIEKFINN